MNIFKIQKNNKGFTLVEVVVSVMILSTALAAILTLSTNSIFEIRYSKNRIIATQLLQESLETVRNIRDTKKQPTVPPGIDLHTLYGTSVSSGGFQECFSANGCYTSLFGSGGIQISACSGGGCPELYLSNASTSTPNVYDASSGKDGNWAPIEQHYVRKITMATSDMGNTVVVTGTITWYDKIVLKTISQDMILTNWSL